MPVSKSKITFVKAENIYLNESKRDRNAKRKCTATDEMINQKKKIVSSFGFTPLGPRSAAKQKLVIPKKTKSKNPSLTRQNQPKSLECPKPVLRETSSSSSFYLTPRQTIPMSEIHFDPKKLPEHFYESELNDFIRTQYPDFEDSSEYDIQDPLPLMDNFDLPQGVFRPENSLRHFKELLDQEESSKNKLLEISEIELLKNIIKVDERHQKLKRDDYLILKEILIGQLKEISEQERVIKMALEKLRSRSDSEVTVNNIDVVKAEKPLENNTREWNIGKVPLTRSADSFDKKNDKRNSVSRQEVDVIFKNVPSLEREIRILRSLSLKLEESLKKSNENKIVAPKFPLILLTTQWISFKHSICIASSTILLFASKSILGLVQEFNISHQTIDELKLERTFYIASDLNNFTLQKTNFDMLRQNPEMLLRRLKPCSKDSRLKFNVIEQDPLFFNHFLANICKISSKSLTSPGTFIPKNHHHLNQMLKVIPTMTTVMDGAGDHFDVIFKEDDTPKLEKPIVMEKTKRTINGKRKSKKYRTPLQEKKIVSSKNNILKIILLGSLHLTIVFILLSAIFYPDITCI